MRQMDDDSESGENSELVADTMSGGKITIRLRVRFAIDSPGGEASDGHVQNRDAAAKSLATLRAQGK